MHAFDLTTCDCGAHNDLGAFFVQPVTWVVKGKLVPASTPEHPNIRTSELCAMLTLQKFQITLEMTQPETHQRFRWLVRVGAPSVRAFDLTTCDCEAHNEEDLSPKSKHAPRHSLSRLSQS